MSNPRRVVGLNPTPSKSVPVSLVKTLHSHCALSGGGCGRFAAPFFSVWSTAVATHGTKVFDSDVIA